MQTLPAQSLLQSHVASQKKQQLPQTRDGDLLKSRILTYQSRKLRHGAPQKTPRHYHLRARGQGNVSC